MKCIFVPAVKFNYKNIYIFHVLGLIQITNVYDFSAFMTVTNMRMYALIRSSHNDKIIACRRIDSINLTASLVG